MNTSLSIKMKSTANKELQKSITYVSASASSADLLSMAQGLTGLTTNTYESADRIQKINVDTESIPGGASIVKTEPTLTVGELEDGSIEVGGYTVKSAEITYNGDGTLLAEAGESTFVAVGDTYIMIVPADESGVTGTCMIYATEGTNYAAKSVTFSFSFE